MGRHRLTNFDLPLGVSIERGAYYFRDRNRIRHPLGKTQDEMLSSLERLGVDRRAMPLRHLKNVFWCCQRNAKERGISFELTFADVEAMWRRSRGKCEATGIPLNILGKWRRRPYAPSIDRIDNSRGYLMENCRLVCVAINLAMNEWGDEVFEAIAKGWLKTKSKRVSHNANESHAECA